MATKKKKGDDDDAKKGMGAKLKPVLVIVAAAAGYKFFLAPKPATTPPADGVNAAAVEEVIEEGPIVTVPELVLNLAGAEQHYLRVGAALVLEKGENAETFAEEVPLASDVLVDVLSSKTPEELSQPGVKTELKIELSEKVREAYHGKKVVRVVFTSFVMQ
jgi:flagellar basal body-associated protein FliL